MLQLLKSWLGKRDGATAIEYGMIVAGIAIGISIIVFTVGDQLEAFFVALGENFD